tara:strand:- start:6347 stop:7399 length:1053 start_codon:yes stop_codon:yes gene_type:complete
MEITMTEMINTIRLSFIIRYVRIFFSVQIIMGGSESKSETHISNEIVNKSVFNAMNSMTNVSEMNMLLNQKLEIKNVKALSCKMSINQKMDLDIKQIAQFESSDSTELNDKIEAELDNALKAEQETESGAGGTSSTSSSDYTNIKNSVRNEMETNITNETVNKLSSKIVANQELLIENLVMDPLGFTVLKELGFAPTIDMMRLASQTSCDINQDMVVKFVAEQLGAKVTKIIQTNEKVNKLVSDTEKKTTTKTQGAGGAVAEAAMGVGGAYAAVAEGVGSGVGTAAEGVGSGVGGAAQGIGAGLGAAMAGPFIPSAISSSSMMAAGMVMMMMSKGGGGPDPAMMAAMMRK